jgi:hypothetical protein
LTSDHALSAVSPFNRRGALFLGRGGAAILLLLKTLAFSSNAIAQSSPARGDLKETSVTPQDFGAVCDNESDDGGALQAAVDYASKNHVKLQIPRCNYAIGRQIVISQPVDITADPSSNLRFTNPSSCGLILDLRSEAANFGLNSVQIGGIYAPATDRAFAFPGYPKAWNTADRSSCDGVTLRGGSRIDLTVKYILGFRAGVSIEATHDTENGPRAPTNVNLKINTADILEYGVRLDGGPAQAGLLAAINVEMNTVFARYPVYFDTTSNAIGQVSVRVTGQAFTNELGGACVYGNGEKLSTSTIDLAWCYAGFSPLDSPQGTPRYLQLPYLAGSGSSNGLRNDGKASAGYWISNNNRISIGVASDQASLPGGFAAGNETVARVRDAARNELNFPFAASSQTAVMLSTQAGEARFAKGIGGLSHTIPARLNVPSLHPGESATFYAYSSILSPAGRRAVRATSLDAAPSGLEISAFDDAAVTNRQIRIVVHNPTANTISSWSGDIWLEIG